MKYSVPILFSFSSVTLCNDLMNYQITQNLFFEQHSTKIISLLCNED